MPGNNTLLKEALNSLYTDYVETVKEWRELGRTEPPVMAIVMNSVKNAKKQPPMRAGRRQDATQGDQDQG